ncbi:MULTISPECIES: BP74-related protein [unclassified Streptomyces]|uniref:BP74-related protein n=1 Tax=unclassified Streptomyces TaxID=2593676 RepID=UPI000AB71733|nr:hypothetical protein [Streptomyces sp. CB02058]
MAVRRRPGRVGGRHPRREPQHDHIPYVDDNVDEAGGPFLSGLVWCDWTSRLVREVAAP